jgi:hypothetical protein
MDCLRDVCCCCGGTSDGAQRFPKLDRNMVPRSAVIQERYGSAAEMVWSLGDCASNCPGELLRGLGKTLGHARDEECNVLRDPRLRPSCECTQSGCNISYQNSACYSSIRSCLICFGGAALTGTGIGLAISTGNPLYISMATTGVCATPLFWLANADEHHRNFEQIILQRHVPNPLADCMPDCLRPESGFINEQPRAQITPSPVQAPQQLEPRLIETGFPSGVIITEV